MARTIPVVLDLETFWSPTHSLTKMSPITYVMHPETEIISCAAKVDGRETFVGFGEGNVTRKLRNFDWSDKLVIAHNNEGFDSMILAWRCGVRPKMWGCTLAMARPIHAKTAGGSLAALVEHYGIGKKDQTALTNTKGRHLKDFTEQEIADMAKYNKTDVDQCWELFKRLLPLTSKDEMKLIDQTIRMLVEPQFVVDRDLLTCTLKDEQERKQKMLLDLATMLGCYHTGMGADEAAEEVSKILGSAPKFGQLLKDLGVTVPTKISPRTGKTAPALAKTDAEFLALQEHEDPTVVAACQARLGVKSTLLESRITAFLQASEAAGGKLPIPTKYYGADTTGRRCLVADTLVIVYNQLTGEQEEKRIVDVLLTDLVWDGEAFVCHDGVAFQGYSEVISWCDVIGTEDHVVFTEAGEVSLSEARSSGVPIEIGQSPTNNDVDAARIYLRHNKEFASV